MNTTETAAKFAATAKGAQIMAAANGVLAELVNRGIVANTHAAKTSAYKVIIEDVIRMA